MFTGIFTYCSVEKLCLMISQKETITFWQKESQHHRERKRGRVALNHLNEMIFAASCKLFKGNPRGRQMKTLLKGLTLRGFFRSMSEWMLSSRKASPTRLFLRTWRTRKGLLASRGSRVSSMKTFCRLAPLTATCNGTPRPSVTRGTCQLADWQLRL